MFNRFSHNAAMAHQILDTLLYLHRELLGRLEVVLAELGGRPLEWRGCYDGLDNFSSWIHDQGALSER